MKTKEDSLFILKLITGEKIMGFIDKTISQKVKGVVVVRNPASLIFDGENILFTNYNKFSSQNFIIFQPYSIVYFSKPNNFIKELYKDYILNEDETEDNDIENEIFSIFSNEREKQKLH